MTKSLRIGVAGLGTVGLGVLEILQKNAALLGARAGRDLTVTHVSSRSKDKERDIDISAYEWVDQAQDLAAADIDVLVECIGGSEGTAYSLVKAALEAGKHVVTSNKALVAVHGVELGGIAEANQVSLNYEASVCGGVPVIKAVREGLAANKMSAVYGILNGTCNYILTQMRDTGRSFSEVLEEAQALGYAEADPRFDVDGIDSGHKLALLAANAFGRKPDFNSVKMQGIGHLTAADMSYASEFGFCIKLLGVARDYDGQVLQTVEPCLVPEYSPLGMIEETYNGVYIACDFLETPLLTGRGAGREPTASSIVADLIDIARGIRVPTFGVAVDTLREPSRMDQRETYGHYYIRLNVLDQPGVIADVSAILRDHNISIEGIIQRGHDPGQAVPVVLTTHETRHADIEDALQLIGRLNVCVDAPCLLRVEYDL